MFITKGDLPPHRHLLVWQSSRGEMYNKLPVARDAKVKPILYRHKFGFSILKLLACCLRFQPFAQKESLHKYFVLFLVHPIFKKDEFKWKVCWPCVYKQVIADFTTAKFHIEPKVPP
jgi:hypothetical protein